MSGRAPLLPGVLLAVSAMAAQPALAQQAPDLKAEFVRAVGQFSLAVDGTFGDEGPAILSHLETMRQALGRWDALVERYEASMRSEIKAADPSLALRMHTALAGVYLDRGRLADGMRELAAARAIDDRRADVHLLLGYASRLRGDSAGALDAFRRASTLDPDDPVRAYVLARQLAAAGQASEATATLERLRADVERRARDAAGPSAPFVRVELFPEVTGVEPFFPPARYAEGFALLLRGEHQQAMLRLGTAAEGDPLLARRPEEHAAIAQAAASLRAGAVADALRPLEAAIAAAPDRAELHRVAGLVYAADEQYEAAIRELAAAVRLEADDERARTALADAYLAQGDSAGAERTLRETLQILPASGRARYALARVLERQGQYPDALRELRAALEHNPLLGANGIYQTIGNLEAAQQNFDAAAEAYATRIDIHPNDAGAHHDLGAVFFTMGRPLEAAVEFLVALMLDGQHVESHAALAQVYLAESNYAEAVNASRRALALQPDHREARYVLATSLIRLGRVDEGQAELTAFQRLQSEDAADRTRRFQVEGFRREAAMRTAAGAHADAAALLRQALALAPESGSVHLDLGLALLAAGDAAGAVQHFSDSLRLDGTVAAYRHLADAYAALGQAGKSEEARAIYQRMKQEAVRRRGASQ